MTWLRLACSSAVFMAACACALADTPAKRSFNVPAADAAVSLKMFADQSGQEIIYPEDNVKGVKTNAVAGDYTPREAIDLLLAGTVLSATQASNGAIAVNRADVPNVQRAAPSVTDGGRPVREDATVRLDPFEVQTTVDTSYGALNSNSIVRFNTELDKVPISADIMSSQFMQDVDTTTIDSLLTAYGAGVGTSFPNAAGQAQLNQPGDRNTTAGFTVRGINAGTIRLNGFVTEASNFVTTTNFDIDRVEIIRGPQGLLYGPGGAGGTIVATTDQAQFDSNHAQVSDRIDEYGSRRTLVKAGAGNSWIAATFDYLNEDDKYSRLFFGGTTDGYYGQVAFRLPLSTTLRVDYQYTRQELINTIGTTGVSFGGVGNDPRNGEQLAYLLYTGQTGATNPATGAAYSKFGAIDNGNIGWGDVYSFPGGADWEQAENYNVDVIADTVWTKWLSTDIGFNFNRLADQFGPQTGGNLSAPLENGNPYNNWAMNFTPGQTANYRRHKNFRAAALATNEFFGGRAKSQSSFGYDFQRQGLGGVTYGYYESDQSGNLILSSSASNLGRITAPQQWWVVDGGPVRYPPVVPRNGAPIFYSAESGHYYVKMLANPLSPAYVTPTNPLGFASLGPGVTGVSGNDVGDYQKEITSSGIYGANFTNWFNDLFTTMLGYRYTYSANHIPNASASTPYNGPVDTSKFGAPSYNVGIDGKILGWLRWYYDYSANYNVSNGETDFVGAPVDESYGKGQEVGLKFTPLESKVSGSFDFYVNNNTDFAINAGSAVESDINPAGLNGQYQGVDGAGTYVPENYSTRGVELILNANPTPNWRMRLAATMSNGTVHSSASYGMLYNDQFYTDGKGNVTYANGNPFLVPVTPGTSVSTLSSPVNPSAILASGPTQQLTTAMIGNPSSPYYAWQGGAVATNGSILSTSNVGRVLKNFTPPGAGTALTGATGLPISDIQYAWPDPGATGGNWVVTQSGQDTVGYPVYQVSLVNSYEIPSGIFKGFGAVLVLNEAWQWRNFYYNTPTSANTPVLWSQRDLGLQINLNPYWRHKFGRFMFRTQLDIFNLTNHYQVEITPNNGAGFTAATSLNLRWDNLPRSYAWSNTLSF